MPRMKAPLMASLSLALLITGCAMPGKKVDTSAYIDTDRQMYERQQDESRIVREWTDDSYRMFAVVSTESVPRRHLFGMTEDMKIVEKIYRIPLTAAEQKEIRARKKAAADAKQAREKKVRQEKPTWIKRFGLGGPEPKREGLRATPLFDSDTKKALAHFEQLMVSGKEKNWEQLVELLHDYSKRYSYLMSELESKLDKTATSRFSFGRSVKQKGAAYKPFARYLGRKVQEDQAFAARSANAWKEGWSMTLQNVIDRLSDSSNASTRRIAIEYLKAENQGETFGYDWQEIPDSPRNQEAVRRWTEWAKSR